MTPEQAERVREELWQRHDNARGHALERTLRPSVRARMRQRADVYAEVLALMATEERRL